MLPPLSDKTNSYSVAFAVLAVAFCNVVFGMDWVSAPAPRRAAATAGVNDTPIVAEPPAAAAGLPMSGNTAAPSNNSAPRPNTAVQIIAPPAPVAETAPPKCDVTACAEAYRSFRESDCTYQPNSGPRRLCTKGVPQ